MNVFIAVAVEYVKDYGDVVYGIVRVGGIGDGYLSVGGGFGAKFLLGGTIEVGVITGVLLF